MIRARPTVAVIDLDAIRHNLGILKPEAVTDESPSDPTPKPRRAKVMAVVKANGYGHGAVPVARAALEAGVGWLGVALVEEGIELRDAGIGSRILVLTEFPPGSEKEAVEAGLTPSLYSEDGLHRLAEAAGAVGRQVAVHVKVDTGMHRVGLDPAQTEKFVSKVIDSGLDLEGVWTHFAVADETQNPATQLQLSRFHSVLAGLEANGMRPRVVHAANSAATMTLPDTHLDLVRIGIAMYGLSPGPDLAGQAAVLRPAMSWRSVVSMARRVRAGEGVSYGLRYAPERDSNIATIPVGYADGYSRLLSNKGEVLIRGRRYPVAGTVTMDQIMVDCGDDAVEPGDEVVLIGRQGDAQVTADELAEWIGTINYEVVCGISPRVPREYVG
jgi:alanine racemase